jgi:L-lactate dehydrogenase complex protein LldE
MEENSETLSNKIEAGIFIPCFIDQVFPQTGINMVRVLEKAGVKALYNPKQSCCGQLAFNGGYWDEARHVAEKFIHDFKDYKIVVGPSASCIGMVKNYYSGMFDNSAIHIENRQLQNKIYEFTDYLVNVLRMEDFGAEMNARATIHDSCAALREYGVKDEMRILLRNVKGLEIIEMKDTDVCCGFGGTFAVKHEAIATAMAEQKVENALETGAEYIISTDSSCLMHIQGYIDRNKIPLKTMHIADVLVQQDQLIV